MTISADKYDRAYVGYVLHSKEIVIYTGHLVLSGL